jgi:hypothetical protein
MLSSYDPTTEEPFHAYKAITNQEIHPALHKSCTRWARTIAGFLTMSETYSGQRRKTSAPLVPPKPKELESATST